MASVGTALNVFAALAKTGEFCTGSVCVDCLFLIANGESENPDPTWDLALAIANLQEYDVNLGHFHEGAVDTRCHHEGEACIDDCDCEQTPFVHGDVSPCWLCESRLGGSRHDIIAMERKLLRSSMTQEQFDKLEFSCQRWSVPMRLGDYLCTKGWGDMAEGWVGGRSGNGLIDPLWNPTGRKTIYLGVEPNGDSHS